MPGKYIAENGLLAQMIIENAAQFYGFIIKPAKGV
jgi:hypothetical protein